MHASPRKVCDENEERDIIRKCFLKIFLLEGGFIRLYKKIDRTDLMNSWLHQKKVIILGIGAKVMVLCALLHHVPLIGRWCPGPSCVALSL